MVLRSALWAGAALVGAMVTVADAGLMLQYDTWPDSGGSVANTGTSATAGTIVNAGLTSYPGPGPDDGIATAPNVAAHFADGGGGLSTGVNTNQSYNSLVAADGSMTMSAWVNLDSATAGSGDHMVFGASAPNGQGLHLGFRNGQAYFGFWGNDSSQNPVLPSGSWHHFTWVYDRPTSSQSIYEDGALLGTAGGHGPYVNGGNLWIGAENFANGSIDGSLDDIRVYDSAFNAAQVSTLFLASSAPDLVPEPASLVLLGLGAVGLFVAARRRGRT